MDNPNQNSRHNRRQRSRNYRESSNPYPIHRNLFLSQLLEQERRRRNMRQYSQRRLADQFTTGGVTFAHVRLNLPAGLLTIPANIATRNLQTCVSMIATPSDANETCSICITNFIRGQTLIRLPCLHKFHSSCIRPWFERTTVCPLCRADFVKTNNDILASAFLQGSAPGPIPMPRQNINITHYYSMAEPIAHIEISSESEDEVEIVENGAQSNVPDDDDKP